MILFCPRCKPNTYQDSKYGFKNRVHNKAVVASGGALWRCTVCKAEQRKDTKKSHVKEDDDDGKKKKGKEKRKEKRDKKGGKKK